MGCIIVPRFCVKDAEKSMMFVYTLQVLPSVAWEHMRIIDSCLVECKHPKQQKKTKKRKKKKKKISGAIALWTLLCLRLVGEE